MEHASYNRSGELITDPLINKLRRILTSTMVLIIAFLVVNICYQFLTGLAGKLLGYPVAVNFNKVNMSRDWHDWNRKRVAAVFLFAPIMSILLGWIYYKIISYNLKWINLFRLFLFWLMICSLNMFLAGLSIAAFGMRAYPTALYNNFAAVAVWMDISTGIMYIITFITVLVSILVGILLGNEVLRFTFSKGLITTQWGKNAIIFQFYVVPVLLSFIPLILLGAGTNIAVLALLVVNLMFIGLGMIIRSAFDNAVVRCNKQDVLNHMPTVEFIVAAGLWAFIFFFSGADWRYDL